MAMGDGSAERWQAGLLLAARACSAQAHLPPSSRGWHAALCERVPCVAVRIEGADDALTVTFPAEVVKLA